MNPSSYAALYSPYQPTQRRPRRGRTVVIVLAAVLWAVTFGSLAWITACPVPAFYAALIG